MFWKLRNRDFVPISWNFLKVNINLTNQVFFKKKNTLQHTYQQRDATTGYCEVLNMKLNIWFDIPSKYIEDFCVIVSVAEGIFSERLTATSSQYFSLCFFAISLIMVKTDVKNVFWIVFFSRIVCHFFSFFGFVSFTCYVHAIVGFCF